MKYRSKNEIYCDILEACNTKEGATITMILYKSYTAYIQLKSHIAELTRLWLIEKNGDRYFLTHRGRMVLNRMTEMNEMIKR